jgi:uncharacterized surface protein with fasciclin (FAS1) repeats
MQLKRFAIALTGAAALMAMAACGSSTSASGGSSSAAAPASTTMASPSSASGGAATSDFGPACSQVPATGAGSFNGMATAPVATAASSNPVLSTLVTAVKKANLVNTLNSAQNITVFAPANSAFAKIPADQLNQVLADNATLTKILTYHVVGQKITPDQLANGSFKTLEGGTITTSGSGQSFTVNGNASVVCGNVQTANATVYIIDTVLMPPAGS